MRRLFAILAVALAMTTLNVDAARAATTVQVVETDPPGSVVTLGRNQNFYLHLHYESGQPVRIWARPYFEGKPAKAGSNPSRIYPAGSGEALGWFFLMQPGDRVDEVRINAGDGSISGTHMVASYPVQITGGDEAAAHTTPGWVTTLNARDEAAEQAAQQKAANTPLSTGDILLFNGFMLTMLAIGTFGLFGPAWGLWRWRGGWRIAAAVPGAMMAFVVLRLIVGVAADPTSHNLWPFEILMAGGLSAAIIGVLMVARKIAGASRA